MKDTSGNPSLEAERSFLKRAWKFSLYTFCLFVFVGIALLSWIGIYASSPTPAVGQGTTVIIPPDIGLKEIHHILAEEGGIKRDIRFRLLAGLMGVAHRMKAGEYAIEPGDTPISILQKIEAGDVVRHPVTVPEGSTINDIAAILDSGNWIREDAFFALADDPKFIKETTGLDAGSIEGYLFPDTYHLIRGQSPQSILLMMTQRFKDVYAAITTDHPDKHGYTRHQILTLASIVEKETGQEDERPLIASVFLNRLHRGIRLQADPTVIYGIKNFNGNLTSKDLITHTPYNTYMISGLPPGPICNAGRASIEAVITMANKIRSGETEEYLYFVSKNDGSHFFSKTLKEHNRAVLKFQKRKKEH